MQLHLIPVFFQLRQNGNFFVAKFSCFAPLMFSPLRDKTDIMVKGKLGWDKVNTNTAWSTAHHWDWEKKENIQPLVITSLFTIFPGASGLLVTMGPSYLQTRAISAQCSKLPSTGLHHAKCSLGGRQKCQLASRSMIHSWNFRTLKKTYNAERIAVCLSNLCVLVLANFI